MEKDELVIYISGPMTGIPEYNFPAFAKAAKYLRDQGVKVVSPHEVEHDDGGVPGSLPHDAYIRGDLIAMLKECNVIVLLPGFSDSRGAMIELQVAELMGFEVKLFDPAILAQL